MALHDETCTHHLEGKNQALMTPYPTGRIPSWEALRFLLLSLILQTHSGAPHSILGTKDQHLLQLMIHLCRLPHLSIPKPLNLNLTRRERQSHSPEHLMFRIMLSVTHWWISRCSRLQSSSTNHHLRARPDQIEATPYLHLLNCPLSTPLRQIQVWQAPLPHSRRPTYSSDAHRSAFHPTTSPR